MVAYLPSNTSAVTDALTVTTAVSETKPKYARATRCQARLSAPARSSRVFDSSSSKIGLKAAWKAYIAALALSNAAITHASVHGASFKAGLSACSSASRPDSKPIGA